MWQVQRERPHDVPHLSLIHGLDDEEFIDLHARRGGA
uniref:Uncharacterized protein n=1 Tax=Arundo donax TaxID=35708 RepID=A0A0A9APY2_ARUDO